MKIALVDSGLGLLAAAAAVRRLRPDADLVLSSDPQGMPWGPRTVEDITERALACGRAAAEQDPDALIVACNTASVHALPALRAELEPRFPVVGTVPAVKPAVATGGPVAVWATPATTGSPYQRRLIEEFGHGVPVREVPCHGLATAIERADDAAIDEAVAAAARLTPRQVRAVVLGCTHYELVVDRIRPAVQPHPPAADAPLALHGSATAVATQALRRAGTAPEADAAPTGRVTVLLSGRPAALPDAVRHYAEGRALAAVRSVSRS